LQDFDRPWYRPRSLKLFRDETNLGASPHLWREIEEGLTRPRWLVVMASPSAAASLWVRQEIRWWLTHRSAETLLMTGACGAPNPRSLSNSRPPGRRPPADEPSTAPPSPADAPEIVGPAPADLHDVDWQSVPAPGEFCGVPELVRFDARGEALVTSSVWGPVRVRLGRSVFYGDTDGDNRDEAVVRVGCDDNGATQNEEIAAGYVVYAHAGKDLAVLGSITPRQKSRQYHTALARAEVAPGRIIVHEKWWRPNDSHCFPSGDAITVWTREGDRLVPGDPPHHLGPAFGPA
jgi:hypothetical protein